MNIKPKFTHAQRDVTMDDLEKMTDLPADRKLRLLNLPDGCYKEIGSGKTCEMIYLYDADIPDEPSKRCYLGYIEVKK